MSFMHIAKDLLIMCVQWNPRKKKPQRAHWVLNSGPFQLTVSVVWLMHYALEIILTQCQRQGVGLKKPYLPASWSEVPVLSGLGPHAGLCPYPLGLCSNCVCNVGLFCSSTLFAVLCLEIAQVHLSRGRIAAKRVPRSFDQFSAAFGHSWPLTNGGFSDLYWSGGFYWFPNVVLISVSIFPKEVE